MYIDSNGCDLREGFYSGESSGMAVYFIGRYDVEGDAIMEGAGDVTAYTQIEASKLIQINDFESYFEEMNELEEELALNRVWLGKKRSQLEAEDSDSRGSRSSGGPGDFDDDIPF